MKLAPDKLCIVIAMREAGYTYSSISDRTGISLSTVKRSCKKHGVVPYSAISDLAKSARQELMSTITDDEALRSIGASLVQDTLLHSEKLRETAANASNQLSASNTEDAIKVMRACAAWANALKLSADATRSALSIVPNNDDNEDLPELIIRAMTDDDVEAERRAQREEAKNLGIVDKPSTAESHLAKEADGL